MNVQKSHSWSISLKFVLLPLWFRVSLRFQSLGLESRDPRAGGWWYQYSLLTGTVSLAKPPVVLGTERAAQEVQSRPLEVGTQGIVATAVLGGECASALLCTVSELFHSYAFLIMAQPVLVNILFSSSAEIFLGPPVVT